MPHKKIYYDDNDPCEELEIFFRKDHGISVMFTNISNYTTSTIDLTFEDAEDLIVSLFNDLQDIKEIKNNLKTTKDER
jgi:hypothetical protein